MSAATLPTSEPNAIAAGDTWRWAMGDSEYSAADGWEMHYAIRGPGALDHQAVTAPDGVSWEIEIDASATAALPPGDYEWVRFLKKGSERYTRASGILTVTPDLATAQPGERITWATKTLEVLESFFAGSIEAGILEHQIAGRAVKFHDPRFLLELRGKLKQEIAASRRKNGRLAPFLVTFGGSRF